MVNKKELSFDINSIPKDELILNEAKAKKHVNDIEKQLDVLNRSFKDISVTLNKMINQKVIKENRIDNYKGLAKKCHSQSIAADKLKNSFLDSYQKDLQYYPIKLLDERISELEKKIQSLTEES